MKGWPECPMCKGTGAYEIDIAASTAMRRDAVRNRAAQRARCYWKPSTITPAEGAPDTVVVKVQMPVYSSTDGPKMALIYDMNKTTTEQRPLTAAEKKIIARRAKVFCEAVFNKAGGWDIIREAKNQHRHW